MKLIALFLLLLFLATPLVAVLAMWTEFAKASGTTGTGAGFGFGLLIFLICLMATLIAGSFIEKHRSDL